MQIDVRIHATVLYATVRVCAKTILLGILRQTDRQRIADRMDAQYVNDVFRRLFAMKDLVNGRR